MAPAHCLSAVALVTLPTGSSPFPAHELVESRSYGHKRTLAESMPESMKSGSLTIV